MKRFFLSIFLHCVTEKLNDERFGTLIARLFRKRCSVFLAQRFVFKITVYILCMFHASITFQNLI